MNQPLTNQQLDQIEARATSEHLTPGPWRLDREQCDCSDGYCHHGEYVTGVITPTPTEIAIERCKRTGDQPRDYDFHRSEIGDFTDADWELMVHARADVPALLAEVRLLRADRSAAALAEVRRLCELTIRASVRVQAIDQARDTLDLIDRVMGGQEDDEEGLSGPCDCGEGAVHYTTAECPFAQRAAASVAAVSSATEDGDTA